MSNIYFRYTVNIDAMTKIQRKHDSPSLKKAPSLDTGLRFLSIHVISSVKRQTYRSNQNHNDLTESNKGGGVFIYFSTINVECHHILFPFRSWCFI